MVVFQVAVSGPLNPTRAPGQEATASGCGVGWLLIKKAALRRAPNLCQYSVSGGQASCAEMVPLIPNMSPSFYLTQPAFP